MLVVETAVTNAFVIRDYTSLGKSLNSNEFFDKYLKIKVATKLIFFNFAEIGISI